MKRYFKADAELEEPGFFYVEVTDGWPSRQVDACGEVWRWGDNDHPKYLGDQSIETFALGPEHEISAAEFERIWSEALPRYSPLKRYFKVEADLGEEIVTSYVQFTDGLPTRQAEVRGEVWRWGDRGHPEHLGHEPLQWRDVGPEQEIPADEFERAWAEALSRCPLP
jgi:hypothetical protein